MARQPGLGRSAPRTFTYPLLVLAAGAVLFSSAAGASEFPTLRPGKGAAVAGTRVRCKADKAVVTSVTCGKVGGLTATIVQTGAVRVTRGSVTFPRAKPRLLHVNGGFEVVGTHGVGLYCHVYVAGKPTITCSVDDVSLVKNSHGFDMTDSSVVVFRYDKTGTRHDVRTFRQP